MNFIIISVVLYIKVHFFTFLDKFIQDSAKKLLITQIGMKKHISKMIYYISCLNKRNLLFNGV